MDERPIGIFDSGLGGLSVLKEAQRQLPQETLIYYGDNANAPYGEKSRRRIRALSFASAAFLMDKGVKAVVVACNTATSVAVEDMRKALPLPVISMEPAVKPALLSRQSGRVLVLATPATVRQPRYLRLVQSLHGQRRVLNIPCHGLVDIIEGGVMEGPALDAKLDALIAPAAGQSISAAVLGCTHYVLVKKAVQAALRRAGFTAPVFDGNAGTVAQLRRVLEAGGLLAQRGGGVELYTSGDARTVLPLYKKALDLA